MAGYGISCFVPNARDVYHSESMTQGLLLEVTESSVWNVLEGSITEHLEQGLVIHSNSPVTAAKDKESGFIKGTGDGKGLPLNWVVAGFSCMGGDFRPTLFSSLYGSRKGCLWGIGSVFERASIRCQSWTNLWPGRSVWICQICGRPLQSHQ